VISKLATGENWLQLSPAGGRDHGKELMTKDAHDEAAERLQRQQDVLAEFGMYAFRAEDLEELLTRASELVAQGCKVQRSKVLELLPDGKELLIRAGVNWNPGVVGHVRLGAGTDSPAGYALHKQEPVISPDLATETRFKIPPVLTEHGIRSMVNVIIAGKQGPFGVLEVDATRPFDFDGHDTAFLQNYSNLLAAAIERHRANGALADAVRSQSVLVRELEHRVKNMLGLVQALARQTNADEPAAQDYRNTFLGRLQALIQAESLVFEDNAQEMDLERLVMRAIEPFRAADAHRLAVDGPPVRVSARVGRMLALVLHELGTNATKYGALSIPGGKVQISWTIEKGAARHQACLRWRERDGPSVRPSNRQGFGTKLLTRLASYDVDGRTELKQPPTGLEYEIAFPLAG
jgi:two-component sensor histidine kinase